MIPPALFVYVYPQRPADAAWPGDVLEALRGLEASCEVRDALGAARYYALESGQGHEEMKVLWRAARDGFVNLAVFAERPHDPYQEPWHDASFLGRDHAGRLCEASRIVVDEAYRPVFVTDPAAGHQVDRTRFARFYEDVVRTLEEVRTTRGAFPEDTFAGL